MPGRALEAGLLVHAGLAVALAMGMLILARPDLGWRRAGLVLALYAVAFASLHLSLRVGMAAADQTVVPIMALLTGLGLVTLFRLRPETALLQVQWILLTAALSGLVVLRINAYAILASYRYVAGVLALVLVGLTLAIGETVGGARAWLQIGPVHFEPSEIGKVLLLLFLAGYLEETREVLALPGTPGGLFGLSWPNLAYLGPVLVMWAVAMALLVVQNDLGAAWLFYGLFLGMLYLATGRRRYVGVGLLLGAVGAFAAYHLVWQVRVRLALWLDPWSDAHGRGFQVVQALFAMASGGFLGTGLGMGNPQLVPAASTDYVLVALGEELGLAGVIVVLAAFVVLVGRAVHTAVTAPDDYGTLLAGGVAVIVGLQVITITGGVTRLLPLTGITVPFLSYGGSALLTNFALMTILLLVSAGGASHGQPDA